MQEAGIALLYVGIGLAIVSFAILFSIMIRNKIWNIHEVWNLCLKGDKRSITYMITIVSAFILLVASQITLRIAH